MTFKEIQKAIKWCKKQGINHLKTPEFEFSAEPKIPKRAKSLKKDEKIEGLTENQEARMPSDGDLLFWSTETFDQMQAGRKEPKARNEI